MSQSDDDITEQQRAGVTSRDDAVLLAMWSEWRDDAVSMATNDELSLEWSMLNQNCYTWDDRDLQLAAELGKTLLERNKELEAGLKQQQRLIDDQIHEIQYLSRQTEGLREVNDSRLRVYEQLEVSIQELESNNQTIKQQLKQHKQRNATLTVDREECRCAELQTLVDQLRSEIVISGAQHPRPPVHQDIQPCSNCTTQHTMAAEMSRQLTEHRSSEREQRRLRREAEQEMSAYRQRCSELDDELEALRSRVVRFQHLTHNLQSLQERRYGPFAAVAETNSSDNYHKMAADVVTRLSADDGFSSADRQIWSTDADHAADIDGSSCTSLLLDSLDRQYRSLLDVMDKHQQQQLQTNNAVVMTTDEPRRLSLLQELSIEDSTVSPIEDSPVSSGFSEAVSMVTSSGSDVGCDVTVVSMATQTCDEPLIGAPSTPSTNHAPEYRRLFREIFHVLQRPRATCGSGMLRAICEADMPRAIHDMDKPRATSDADMPRATNATDMPRATNATDMPRALSNAAEPRGAIPCSTKHIPCAIIESAQSLPETVHGEFSFSVEFEKQKAARGASTELPDEFPATLSASADVAKLCLLERSYADTLKAGVHRGRNSCPR